MTDVSADAPSTPALLTLKGVVKTFPGVRALDGVELSVRPGEVHCLLGQNGAGKSSLIKVLSGVHRPDSGEIRWRGSPVSFADPQAAMRAGIATIYQELDLVHAMTVAENVFLGHEPRTAGFVRRARMKDDARQVLARLGHAGIPLTRPVGRLPTASQQIVSMARALSFDAKLLIMDEPSAVLAHDEVENLFRIIRELRAQGIAVIYISHRLEEIREICDRVTVLKDGRGQLRSPFPPGPPPDCCGSKGSPGAANSPTSRSLSDPVRSSASPGSSARDAPNSWRPSSERVVPTAAKC